MSMYDLEEVLQAYDEASKNVQREKANLVFMSALYAAMNQSPFLKEFSKHIGKMRINISGYTSKEDLDLVRQIAQKLAVVMENQVLLAREEFGDDYEQIFLDAMAKYELKF